MIIDGSDPRYAGVIVRGVSFEWLAHHALQLTDAPGWYSLRARMLGNLCGSCDLGLPYGCQCPPSEPRVPRIITLPSL